MKLTKDEELETEWTNKKGLMKRYEHLNVNTLSHWLMEMRRSRDFRKYVINPTPKLVWININGFHEFLFVYKGKIKEKKEYHGVDKDDQDITWESLKIINELKPSIFSELAGFKNKNHIIHLVNTD